MTDVKHRADWIEWDGGDCPVPRGTLGWLRFRVDPTAEAVGIPYDISRYRWEHAEYAFRTPEARTINRRYDIIAYARAENPNV